MAFCSKGKCIFGKTSAKGYPQCTKCGRVDITGRKKASKGSTTRKRSTKQARKSTVKSGWAPFGGHMRKRAQQTKGKRW